MQKLKSTIYLLSFLWVSSIILYSCCEDTYDIIDGDGQFYVQGGSCLGSADLCTVSSEFRLIYEARFEEVGFVDFVPIQSALATSCAETFLNKVDLSTVLLTFDKDFIFDDAAVPAGTNIAELPEVIVDGFQQGVDFNFKAEMLARTKMLSDTITISFSAVSTNDIALQAQTQVIFDL